MNEVYTWFAEPLDKDANVTIGRMIDPCDNRENYLEAVRCADGQCHNLWQLPNFQMVSTLRNSRRSLHLRYNIWVREGHGAIRQWFARRQSPIKTVGKLPHAAYYRR